MGKYIYSMLQKFSKLFESHEESKFEIVGLEHGDTPSMEKLRKID